MAKKLTKNQQAYQNAVRNLQRRVKRAEAAGVRFDAVIPEKPNRIYKRDIDRLNALRGEALYAKGTAYVGESLTGKVGGELLYREQRQSNRTQAQLSRAINAATRDPRQNLTAEVLRQALADINNFNPPRNWSQYMSALKRQDKNLLLSYLYQAIKSEGVQPVAARLEANKEKWDNAVFAVLLESKDNKVKENLNKIVEILKGRPLTNEDSIEINEYYENYISEYVYA